MLIISHIYRIKAYHTYTNIFNTPTFLATAQPPQHSTQNTQTSEHQWSLTFLLAYKIVFQVCHREMNRDFKLQANHQSSQQLSPLPRFSPKKLVDHKLSGFSVRHP